MNHLIKRNRRNAPGIWDDFFNKAWLDWPVVDNQGFMPATNVQETETEFTLEIAAPGLAKEDFKLHLDRNVLTISSEKESNKEETEGENYTRREFSYQSFKRGFTLPETVDGNSISAKYDNGILYVSIPKKEKPVETSKQIEIS